MQNQEAAWLLREKYQGQDCPEYQEDLARLAAGEPLGYLIGHTPFLGCKIWLDSRPLIPRPETEYWVERAIIAIKDSLPRADLGNSLSRSAGRTVLDLCAGSGAIGVAVAKHIPEVQVALAEIDATHIPTIEKNCRHNLSIQQMAAVTVSNLFKAVTGRFDFILSNPPYIDPALDRTDDSVKNYEPHLALYGGQDGLTLIAKIITQAPAHLHPQGQLWIEHEPEQAAAITSLGAAAGFTVTTHTDQYGVLRYSVLVLQ
jgi:release factor glutamine methyltransferase